MTPVTVVGAGFAGCEAAWTLAQNGIPVTLWEMKPQKFSPAHHSPDFAELICSNSFKASRLESAAGLLKAEMERLGSLCVPCSSGGFFLRFFFASGSLFDLLVGSLCGCLSGSGYSSACLSCSPFLCGCDFPTGIFG